MKCRPRIRATALAVSLLGGAFTISIPASAGDRGGGTNWGAVAGAGILGGILGSALTPAPQPQQIIVVVPQAPQPAPAPPPPPQPPRFSLSCGGQWYPIVKTCASKWQATVPGPYPMFAEWCPYYQQWAPAVTTCPGRFLFMLVGQ